MNPIYRMNQNSNVAVLDFAAASQLEIRPDQIKAWLEKHLNTNEVSCKKNQTEGQKFEMICMSPWG